jgi:diacylglycerol kinase (ATP)
MRTLFLINPLSGRKQHAEAVERIIYAVYEKAEEPVAVQFIDFARLDEDLARAIAGGTENIFAVGGDGTVNAIGTRLIGKPVKFGVIPKGSGNGYARNLGFSTNTQLAISQSVTAWSIRVDTGRFNDIPFLNVAGVGLDAEVAHHFALGKRRGFMTYARSSTRSLLSYHPVSYQIVLDSVPYLRENIMGIAIANGTQWGYDAKISPHARLRDGLLDVIVVKKFPFIDAASIVRRLFSGQIKQSRYVEVFQAKRIEIHRQAGGPAQVDGEPLVTGADISIELVEKSLEVLLPNTLTPGKIEAL